MDPERVFVVGEAADPVFRKLPQPVPGPVMQQTGIDGRQRTIVYVGGFSPHKNLQALVDAFAQLSSRPAFSDTRLVMVGETSRDAFHSEFWAIASQVEKLGLRDRVVFTGYMPDEELVVLLNMASVLVLPSLMEGFGLPAVEAAACGCPVIATTASPLPGLLGGGGIYIHPDEAGIAAALEVVLSSAETRRCMGERGRVAAANLTWDRAAQQMIEVIRKVATQ
jgi:glycosyltransferase involved in cell wall biosynthesis